MNKIKEIFSHANHIVIVGHFNPDGDAVGSAMALHLYLKKLGKKSTIIFPNELPRNLEWLDPDNVCMNYMKDPSLANSILMEADYLICVDFHSLDRSGPMQQILSDVTAKKMLIDHHIEEDMPDYDWAYTDVSVSSTCEKIYRIIQDELDLNLIDKQIATCLYAGLCTDTGSFRYSCSHPELYETVADLIDKGLNTMEVHQNIFNTFTEDRMRMVGFCFSENLIIRDEYKTAYMYLDKDVLDRFNYKPGDLEGVVHYALSIRDIKFVAFFTEHDRRIRVSFRSKGNIDVHEFAKKHFDGGGHKNLAGGSSFGSLDDALRRFEAKLPAFYESHIKGN